MNTPKAEMDLAEIARPLIRAAWEGTLTEDMLGNLIKRSRDFEWTVHSFGVRSQFTREVGWSLPTVGYLDALFRVVATRKVVEVCAGSGIIGKLMRERGANWTSTDKDPWPNSVDVRRLDAVEAVRTLKPELVFASWIPLDDTLDYELARMGRPCIYITEGPGGCIGSDKFWERSGKDGYHISDYEEHPDVPRWVGLHDHTILTVPEPGFKPATPA